MNNIGLLRPFAIGSVWLLTGVLAPAVTRADQFVLFDVTFTFTKADADNSRPSKSHYYVRDDAINPKRPRDWTTPVDYRNGTVHIRTEVIDKPAGGEPTTWSLCYIPNRGRGNGYGCTGTVIYREKGVYDQDVSMKLFWQNDAIVWSEGIKQMDLVIKDNSGGQGHAHNVRTGRSSSRPRCASRWCRYRPVRNTIRAWFPICRVIRAGWHRPKTPQTGKVTVMRQSRITTSGMMVAVAFCAPIAS